MRDTIDEKEQVIKEINSFFRRKKAFFLCCSVTAPYNGCFHEPNMFLVCPEGNKNEFEGDLVKCLYASGQGEGVGKLTSKKEIIQMVRDERVPNEPSWKSIDSFTTGDASKPINEGTPVNDHYWGQAIRLAEEELDIQLTWKCGKCEQVIEGGTYESEPQFTGYHGNGGIGVFMEGAICSECVDNGLCSNCGREGWPHECYDPDIAEKGYDLCETCVEQLLDKAIFGEVDLNDTVLIEWYKDESQLDLSGIENPKILRITDIKGKPIEGLTLDPSKLLDNAKCMNDCSNLIDPKYGRGVYLKGEYVEKIASNNMD